MQQCADCHGSGATVTQKGAALRPPARSMGDWALAPDASFKIISEGYPGTDMKGYGQIPEGVRWAIVRRMYQSYEKE
jgi:mono/diheme cytochrome c family protein